MIKLHLSRISKNCPLPKTTTGCDMLPGEVCDVMHKENVSLQAAWRILRGMSQQEVAEKLGISQSAVSQLEALDSRPQKRTREKLAAIYGCTQEQISLYLPKEG